MEGNWAASSAENEKHKTHWSDDETRALLKVWEDHLSDLRKTKRNLKVYVAIAECLRAQGVEKSVKEIKSKMENLGNRCRNLSRKTTGQRAITWRFYKDISRFLGSLPMNDSSLTDETCGEDATVEIPAPRRTLNEHGFLDVEAMDNDVFYRMFRFEKIDFRDLVSTLQIPEEVVSAQRVRVSGNEALCITLRRLAYPNRLCELELLFNRHSSVLSSVVSTVLAHIEYHFDHLLADLTTHQWLNLLAIENFSKVNTNGIHKSAHHT
ncbi:myb/SANT-like DNA-binding domain-containing protein 1 [Dermacentor silvarum]|uniref:myb/SANT-like DNA-binding domain-containing protein 1 n=1 Tax=Dermacentor silvarum TaxID=543639 RepID=UPI00189AD63F|nr:myb/SANT-like DNA-binding domain-containing protein 1 [Dermacentor silvarum]XP_037564688.1 myb/SANT-like DNA-binding domain-containing protein 1 [Dermacentor silvarum]